MIINESLRLLDAAGIDGFSLLKLGRALGADQTAVYRHFASKDDLILAIADQLNSEALAGLEPPGCWVVIAGLSQQAPRPCSCHPPAAPS